MAAAFWVAGLARADEGDEQGDGSRFEWKEPRIGSGVFSDDLGLLEREREEYANSFAEYAVNRVARDGASSESLAQARRFLALSMHLSPRNRRALVANYQLSRGILPTPVDNAYSDEVLSQLMFTRAQLLRDRGDAENKLLARIFIEVAAELDPKNEDAVYASEIQRLDHGRVDWTALTDVPGPGERDERDDEPLP